MRITDRDLRRVSLERRLERFHQVSLEQVLDVIDYLREPGDSVLVGGSLAYGLGNARSDLDIVLAGPATEESSSRMPLEHFVESLRVDVWKLRQDEIDHLFSRAHAGLSSEAPFAGAFGDVFEQADLKLLHRVAYGTVIDGPPLTPAETHDHTAIARDLIVREYAERMRHSLYVAQTALAAGDSVGATINARFGIEEALQAVLASRSLPFSDNKWLRVRLDQDAQDLRPLHASFATLPEGAVRSREFVRDAVAAAETLSGLSLGAEELAHRAVWRNTDLQMRTAGEVRLLISPTQGVIWELEDRDVRTWESLADDGEWPCASCDRDQQILCFGLYREGVLRLEWTRGLPVAELRSGQGGQT